jgi:uncharacterized protein (DUF488 family)
VAVDQLLGEAATGREAAQTALMCAETVWWRCHRRMLADYLVLARGVAVRHLRHDGKNGAAPAKRPRPDRQRRPAGIRR